MEELIDRPQQWTKSFIEPLRFITDKINWSIDGSDGRQGTLEDFFWIGDSMSDDYDNSLVKKRKLRREGH